MLESVAWQLATYSVQCTVYAFRSVRGWLPVGLRGSAAWAVGSGQWAGLVEQGPRVPVQP